MMSIGDIYESYNGFNIKDLNLSEGRYSIKAEALVAGVELKAEGNFIVD